MRKETTTKWYQRAQAALGWLVGDRVLVHSTPDEYRVDFAELGWVVDWAPEMDDYKGKISEIEAIEPHLGIRLKPLEKVHGEGFWFPFFVLDNLHLGHEWTVRSAQFYTELSKFKEGDFVRVMRKAPQGELGWDNSWPQSPEQELLGKVGVVMDVKPPYGVRVMIPGEERPWWFPWISLRHATDDEISNTVGLSSIRDNMDEYKVPVEAMKIMNMIIAALLDELPSESINTDKDGYPTDDEIDRLIGEANALEAETKSRFDDEDGESEVIDVDGMLNWLYDEEKGDG